MRDKEKHFIRRIVTEANEHGTKAGYDALGLNHFVNGVKWVLGYMDDHCDVGTLDDLADMLYPSSISRDNTPLKDDMED